MEHHRTPTLDGADGKIECVTGRKSARTTEETLTLTEIIEVATVALRPFSSLSLYTLTGGVGTDNAVQGGRPALTRSGSSIKSVWHAADQDQETLYRMQSV